MTIESVVSAARARSQLPANAPFWVDELSEAPLSKDDDPALLSSYAHTYWYKHLRVLLESSEQEAKPYLSAFGRFIFRDTIVEALSVQLQIVNLWRLHGQEISKEVIDRPIVISGPPRTMTTHAQAILANHPDVWFLRFSEGRNPLFPVDVPVEDLLTKRDPRHKFLNMGKVVVNYLRPFFYYMFRFNLDDIGSTPQEDIFFQALTMSSPQFETNSFLPSYSKLWHTESNLPSFRFLKMVQQTMQWQKKTVFGIQANRRWLMKTPEHAGFVRDLMTVYPDAHWILMHRDPVPVVRSFVPMILYIQGLWNQKIDAKLFGEYQLQALEQRLNHLVEQVDIIPVAQILHVPFREFNSNNTMWIESMCSFAGLPWNEEIEKNIKSYIAKSPRDGANKFEYRIDSFGSRAFDDDALQLRFSNYITKFQQYI